MSVENFEFPMFISLQMQLIRKCRVPEYEWTMQKVFHFLGGEPTICAACITLLLLYVSFGGQIICSNLPSKSNGADLGNSAARCQNLKQSIFFLQRQDYNNGIGYNNVKVQYNSCFKKRLKNSNLMVLPYTISTFPKLSCL